MMVRTLGVFAVLATISLLPSTARAADWDISPAADSSPIKFDPSTDIDFTAQLTGGSTSGWDSGSVSATSSNGAILTVTYQFGVTNGVAQWSGSISTNSTIPSGTTITVRFNGMRGDMTTVTKAVEYTVK